MSDRDYMLAEFKGNYRAPDPDGIRDKNVTKEFHVKVKMKRECLQAPGLNGLFVTYYKELVRKLYPDMIDFYRFNLVQATELDGKAIDNPKALNYEGLLEYISRRGYPINPLLYSPTELRNEVILYETDRSGQQFLQAKLEKRKGNMLAIAGELRSLDDVVVMVEPVKAAPSVDELVQAGSKRGK